MYSLDFDITIGGYRLTMLESVTVKAGVENLADTAVVVLPATVYNKALEIEGKIKEGDAVAIRFGYDVDLSELPVEFEGYVESIATDDGSIKIQCEDELYNYRKDLTNKVFTDATVKEIMEYVNRELGGFDLSCD